MYFMPNQVFKSSLIAGFQQQRHQYIADGLGSSARKTRRNVRHTVMDYAILHEDRLLMAGDFRSLETPTAVDAHIDDHAAGPHIAHHFLRYHNRRAAGRRAEGADSYFAGFELFGQNAWFDDRGPHTLADIVL